MSSIESHPSVGIGSTWARVSLAARRGGAAALLVLTAGCGPEVSESSPSFGDGVVSESTSPAPTRYTPDMRAQCLEQPIVSGGTHTIPEWKAGDPGVITLHHRTADDPFAIVENPVPEMSAEVMEKIIGATVAIETAPGKLASGVLIEVPGYEYLNGRIVLTAGHVQGTKIIDTKNDEAQVMKSCAIFQGDVDRDGEVDFINPASGHSGFVDVRISILDKAIGTSTVGLSEMAPSRGQWGITANYHSDDTMYRNQPDPENPHVYADMFVTDQSNHGGVLTLSGIGGGARTVGSKSYMTRCEDGSSGGGMFDNEGNLLGIINAGYPREYVNNPAKLMKWTGVEIEPHPYYVNNDFPPGVSPMVCVVNSLAHLRITTEQLQSLVAAITE